MGFEKCYRTFEEKFGEIQLTSGKVRLHILLDTRCLAYMKNKSTASIHSRGLKVLLPKGFNWKEAGVGDAKEPINETELS